MILDPIRTGLTVTILYIVIFILNFVWIGPAFGEKAGLYVRNYPGLENKKKWLKPWVIILFVSVFFVGCAFVAVLMWSMVNPAWTYEYAWALFLTQYGFLMIGSMCTYA
jgi:hypothetical protein